MKLSRFDGKTVRLKTVYGETFEGEAEYDSSDYCFHEFGEEEDALEIDNWLFYNSQIAEIRIIEPSTESVWLDRPMKKITVSQEQYTRIDTDGETSVPVVAGVNPGDALRIENEADTTDVLIFSVDAVLDGFAKISEFE